MSTTILKPGPDEDNISALYGVGLLIDLGEERDDGSAMQLRGELGGRRDADRAISIPRIWSTTSPGLGLQYSWGGSATRRVVDTDGDGVTRRRGQVPGHARRHRGGLERLPAAAGR